MHKVRARLQVAHAWFKAMKQKWLTYSGNLGLPPGAMWVWPKVNGTMPHTHCHTIRHQHVACFPSSVADQLVREAIVPLSAPQMTNLMPENGIPIRMLGSTHFSSMPTLIFPLFTVTIKISGIWMGEYLLGELSEAPEVLEVQHFKSSSEANLKERGEWYYQ